MDVAAGKGDRAGDGPGLRAPEPTEAPQDWVGIVRRAVGAFQRKQMGLLAAGVAFWSFLSLFPALVAALSLFGLVADPATIQRRVDDLLTAIPAEGRTLISNQMTGVASSSGGALGLGLAVSIGAALWSASAAASNLMTALNVVYDVSDDRSWINRKALALAGTLGGIVFAGLALVAAGALPAALRAADLPGWLGVLVWPVLGVGFVAGLAVVYRFGADRDDPEWSWASPGAIMAVVIWMVASVGFQVYLANFGRYQETYGALAAVVVLLLWLLLTSLSVLLGALVNAEVEAQTAHDTTVGPDRPMGQRDAENADHLGPIPGS
ncbi:MAG: YihY/virulence factor BrkB family protein [Acidimicrobiia bacterium]|nr:YihY/virulence factor BrkB family protein [Acidimicrobiia bacterium]